MTDQFSTVSGKRQAGFTLVEIAIVLVIIGLILGGVLKGQSLIENAEYKNFVKQVDSYRAAYFTFRDTYRGLPGDLANVSALDSAAVAGNGDGNISGGYCDAAEESCNVWSHLRYAGLIAGDPSDTSTGSPPSHTYGGLVSSISTGSWANGVTETKLLTRSIPGDVAQRYDNEFDDGDATTGSIARYQGSGTSYDPDALLAVFITL
ncbi:prokaryotic N-methylation site [Gammaproteobacteria bacterium 50_400_T64]|nr:prokaryotic N-methylation site [Gammaproteobacteria bacterium 50_400_T64]